MIFFSYLANIDFFFLPPASCLHKANKPPLFPSAGPAPCRSPATVPDLEAVPAGRQQGAGDLFFEAARVGVWRAAPRLWGQGGLRGWWMQGLRGGARGRGGALGPWGCPRSGHSVSKQ